MRLCMCSKISPYEELNEEMRLQSLCVLLLLQASLELTMFERQFFFYVWSNTVMNIRIWLFPSRRERKILFICSTLCLLMIYVVLVCVSGFSSFLRLFFVDLSIQQSVRQEHYVINSVAVAMQSIGKMAQNYCCFYVRFTW